MSDFSGLKKQRKAKDFRSFIATNPSASIGSSNDIGKDVQETNLMNTDSESCVEGSPSTTTTNGTTPLPDEGLYSQIVRG